jgi:hypothetical protein
MNKLSATLAAAAVSALVAGPAMAQIPHITPFSFEGRAGIANPTGDFGDAAGPGYGLSGSVTYHAIPLIGIYGGYSWNRFSVDDADGDFTDSGIDVGARLGIPTPMIPIDPYLKAGLVFHQMKLTGAELGNFSDRGTGVELGAGVGLSFGPVSLVPGVSWVSYKVDEGGSSDAKVSFVKADVGVRIRI